MPCRVTHYVIRHIERRARFRVCETISERAFGVLGVGFCALNSSGTVMVARPRFTAVEPSSWRSTALVEKPARPSRKVRVRRRTPGAILHSLSINDSAREKATVDCEDFSGYEAGGF